MSEEVRSLLVACRPPDLSIQHQKIFDGHESELGTLCVFVMAGGITTDVLVFDDDERSYAAAFEEFERRSELPA